jgi:site-specific recombinase XerD
MRPHLFRHASATHFLEGGADLRVVQDFLGHAIPATTERYTHVTRGRKLAVYSGAHPRALARESREWALLSAHTLWSRA